MPILINNNATREQIDNLAVQELTNTREDIVVLERYTRNLLSYAQSTYRGDVGVRDSMRRLMIKYRTNLNAFNNADGIRLQIENFERSILYSDRMIPLLSSQLLRWEVARNIVLPRLTATERSLMQNFEVQNVGQQRVLSERFSVALNGLSILRRQELAAQIKIIIQNAIQRIFNIYDLGGSLPARGDYNRGNINITVRDTAKLIWIAICDDAIYNLRAEERQLVERGRTTEAAIKARNMQDRKFSFFKSLWEFQTEYGNSAACAHGSYNKLVETLSMVHPDVNIEEGLSIDHYVAYVNNWLVGQDNPPGHLASRVELYNRNQHLIGSMWDTTEFYDGVNENEHNNKLMSVFKAQIRVDVRGYIEGTAFFIRINTEQKRSIIASVMENIAYLPVPDNLKSSRRSAAMLVPIQQLPAALAAIPDDAVPTGYDPANEFLVMAPILARTLTENLLTTPVRTGAVYRSRVVLNTRNTAYMGPYSDNFGVGLDFPNIPCIHPYEPNGQIHPAPYDNGNPSFPIAISLPGVILSSLPEGIRELLIRNNINFNRVTVNFGVQNMPWNNAEQLLFRAHPLVHQNAPRSSAAHYRETTNIYAGIFDINARMEQLAPLEVMTHNENDEQVVFSPPNAQITGINAQESHSFYSVCIIPANGGHPARAVITLHWLLNRNDYIQVADAINQYNANGIAITLEEIIRWPATWYNGTLLNVPFGGITSCDALRTLCTIGGDRANANLAANRYRLQEQIILGNQILASGAQLQTPVHTSGVHDTSSQEAQPEVTTAPNVLSSRELLRQFEVYWESHRSEFPAGFMPRRNGIPAGWIPSVGCFSNRVELQRLQQAQEVYVVEDHLREQSLQVQVNYESGTVEQSQRQENSSLEVMQQDSPLSGGLFTMRQFEAYWETHRGEFPAGFMPRRNGVPAGWIPPANWTPPRP